ncbi:hypothetical protein EDD86DRAFT_205537 [Gorgonomyces haynaldii]|nr:hypothetical protein EDD86DRAFT_205537 [Gorgonomyces haynaldii]
MTRISDLPPELIQQILLYCDPSSVVRLLSSSKSLHRLNPWPTLLHHRFKTISDRPLQEYKKRHLYPSYPEFFSIAWLDDNYWSLANRLDSTSGTVAVLRSVCWMDCSTVFEHVMPGRYHLKIKMRSLENSYSLSNVTVEYTAYQETTPLTISKTIGTFLDEEEVWKDFILPPMDLPTSTHVRAVIYDHSGRWKSGLEIDSIKLVRGDPPEVLEEAPAVVEQTQANSMLSRVFAAVGL